jgi:hypothetical protein
LLSSSTAQTKWTIRRWEKYTKVLLSDILFTLVCADGQSNLFLAGLAMAGCWVSGLLYQSVLCIDVDELSKSMVFRVALMNSTGSISTSSALQHSKWHVCFKPSGSDAAILFSQMVKLFICVQDAHISLL